jgi:hypothetical protein
MKKEDYDTNKKMDQLIDVSKISTCDTGSV